MRRTRHHQVLPKHLFAAIRQQKPQIEVSRAVVESAALDAAGVYTRLATRSAGLATDEAAKRLAEHGPNVLAKDRRPGLGKLLWNAVVNPLVILLLVLAAVSFATGDVRAGVVMSMMIVLGAGLKLVQEARADSAAVRSFAPQQCRNAQATGTHNRHNRLHRRVIEN
jgi:Mg2+-importing ATPase